MIKCCYLFSISIPLQAIRVLLLLSLRPPSYMVVSNRELANVPFSFNTNNPKESFTGMVIDMEVDMPRGHSVSLSTNGSRASSTHSYTSSMEYAEYVKAITNNTT